MSLPVIFHDAAERELNEAAAYYARVRPGLGEQFLAEAAHSARMLSTTPSAGHLVEQDVRWWLVRRFPYSLVYRARTDSVRILAVAHQKRRPYFWRGRH